MKKILIFALLFTTLSFTAHAKISDCKIIDIQKELKSGRKNVNNFNVDGYFCFKNANVKNFDYGDMEKFGFKYGLSKQYSFGERHTIFYALKNKVKTTVKVIMSNGKVYYINLYAKKSLK
jgi:hypothetical protein